MKILIWTFLLPVIIICLPLLALVIRFLLFPLLAVALITTAIASICSSKFRHWLEAH